MTRRGATLGGAAGLSLLLAWPAAAQSNPLKDGLFPGSRAPAPQAILYGARENAVRFVLDRSTPRRPLLIFLDQEEVFALVPVVAARGDEILTLDTGEPMLRINALGGVTVYGPLGANGAPAAPIAPTRPIASPAPPADNLRRHMQRAVRDISARHRRTIDLQAPADLPAGMGADAVDRVRDGLLQALDGASPGRRAAQGVRAVTLVFAQSAFAVRDADRVIVGVAPSLGYAGRPSSGAVRRAAETLPRQSLRN